MLGKMGHLLLLLLQGRPHLMDLAIGVGAGMREGVVEGTGEEVDESVDVVGGGGLRLRVGLEGIFFVQQGLLGLGGEF
jgi:hypothetical protein